jgi:hypothetical protein
MRIQKNNSLALTSISVADRIEKMISSERQVWA